MPLTAQRSLLRNGIILDGTGSARYRADLLIEDERIAAIGKFDAPPDARVIDCSNLAIAPGFIDGHSHSDLQVIEQRKEKTDQGVTTEVVGNCGFSAYPSPNPKKPLHEFANGIFCGNESWGWDSAAEYLKEAAKSPLVNVESLVGHGSLRIWRAGSRQGTLSPSDVDAMCHRLDEFLQQGACGLSTGLMYAPGSSAPFEELESLCRVVRKHGKICATHMRDYTDHLVPAVEEQIALARRTDCEIQISHFQVAGARNWHRQTEALERIEDALADGLKIGLDCYPYLRGSTVLTQILPQWALDGGTGALLKLLSDPAARIRVAAAADASLAQGWNNILISAVGSSRNQTMVGLSLEEIGALRGLSPVDAAMDLLIEEQAQVNILEINQSEENLRQVIRHPQTNIISDGFYVKGKPHPRLYGTFPFLLGEIARERKWLTLEESVRKITGLPAERFGISERGFLVPGFYADIVVFDAATVYSKADYDNPAVSPTGIRHVFRNGTSIGGEGANIIMRAR